mmetsp:Transcript_42121/g.86060  ORF Transcript_42121/g.86060 Transcript_42121/m.86060 type:complete len:326 (+) Transcript_42121:474-1451(+)
MSAALMNRRGSLPTGVLPPSEISKDLVDTDTVNVRKEEGVKYVNQYEIVKDLGKGSFGKVKLVKHTETGELFAMKVFNKHVLRKKRMGSSRNLLQDVELEIKVMKMLDHPNCLKLYEVLDSPDYHKMFLRVEYAPAGVSMSADDSSDQPQCEPLSEEQARAYMHGLVAGLEYMHSKRIIHRDVKPENLLLSSNMTVKVADFGTSQILDGEDDMINKSAGTPAFTAPEACVEGDFSGFGADVWAAGVTLYMFVHGRCPFMSSNLVQIFQMIREEPLTCAASLSNECSNLLSCMLEKDFTKRITLQEMKKHPWMQGPSAPTPDNSVN